MKGNQILIQENPRGVKKAIIVSGTPKPGTAMSLKLATAADANGLLTYEPAGTTAADGFDGMTNDGDRCDFGILLEDENQGKTYDSAYADGDHGWIYFPLPGEELNVLLENQSGTGDAFAVGDKLMIDNGTGKFLAVDTDAEAEPFVCAEAVAALTADAWVWAIRSTDT